MTWLASCVAHRDDAQALGHTGIAAAPQCVGGPRAGGELTQTRPPGRWGTLAERPDSLDLGRGRLGWAPMADPPVTRVRSPAFALQDLCRVRRASLDWRACTIPNF